MKKLALIFFCLSFILVIEGSGQNFPQSTSLGGGISFGTSIDYHHVYTGKRGIQLIGIRKLYESFQVSAAGTFFLPVKKDFYDGTRSSTLLMIEADAQYFIFSRDDFMFYTLGGLSTALLISNYKGESPDLYPDYSDQSIGLDLGAGANLLINETTTFFGEMKYVVSKYPQLIISAGIVMKVDWF